jgi:hypothetical protein
MSSHDIHHACGLPSAERLLPAAINYNSHNNENITVIRQDCPTKLLLSYAHHRCGIVGDCHCKHRTSNRRSVGTACLQQPLAGFLQPEQVNWHEESNSHNYSVVKVPRLEKITPSLPVFCPCQTLKPLHFDTTCLPSEQGLAVASCATDLGLHLSRCAPRSLPAT